MHIYWLNDFYWHSHNFTHYTKIKCILDYDWYWIVIQFRITASFLKNSYTIFPHFENQLWKYFWLWKSISFKNIMILFSKVSLISHFSKIWKLSAANYKFFLKMSMLHLFQIWPTPICSYHWSIHNHNPHLVSF